MQTFLPYSDFALSARVLDVRRLGKQRVEARQLLRAIDGVGGWVNHPAARMWRGYGAALGAYMDAMITEWAVYRKYRNTIPYAFDAGGGFSFAMYALDEGQIKLPPWLGDPRFHASHRSNLLRKDPAYYGQFGWTESADLPYVWPK